MKRLLFIAGAAILLLAGCFLAVDNGSGSVGIELPEPRSVTGDDPADAVRIYVINGPDLVEVGDTTPWAEIDLTADAETLSEVTVGPVPSGAGYRVVLVFGNYEAGADGPEVFVPVEYDLSAEFTVLGGQTNLTEILDPDFTPFVNIDPGDTLGRSIVGIVFDGAGTSTGLYAATASGLYRATGGPGSFGTINFGSTPATPPGGRVITSLGLGAGGATELSEVWVNTDAGVLPYDGATFDTTFSTPVEDFRILDSGGFYLPGGSLPGVYGYVQYDGGLSAVRDLGSQIDWLQPIDLSDVIAGTPITSMDVEESPNLIRGYFATKLGAFRLHQDILQLPQDPPPTAQDVFEFDGGDLDPANDTAFFEVNIDGTNAVITELDVADVPGADQFIFIGTPRGALRVAIADIDVADDQNPDVDALLIAETAGEAVVDIVATGNYAAIVTTHFLVYSTNANATSPTFTAVPLYASVVGEVTGLLLDSATGSVLIAGNGGLVGIPLE